MSENFDAAPQLPKDGEVFGDVQCGCCRESGNVVAKILPSNTNDEPKYKFECNPDRTNTRGKKGCGMSVEIPVRDLSLSKVPRDVFVGSEMESAFKKDLGSPHHPR